MLAQWWELQKLSKSPEDSVRLMSLCMPVSLAMATSGLPEEFESNRGKQILLFFFKLMTSDIVLSVTDIHHILHTMSGIVC